MRTYFEGQPHQVYGEPTRSMVEEFIVAGLGIVECWPGEVASYYQVAGREVPAATAAAIVQLCERA